MASSIERITINPDQCGGRSVHSPLHSDTIIDVLDLFAEA